MAVLLGRTSAGTSADFNGSGHAALWKFTATASGRLATIFAQTKVANATGTVTLAIYSDSAGVANVRLAKATVSGTGTGTGVFSADVSASAVDIVNGTVYWLGWRNSAETMDFQGDASGVYDESLGTVDFIDPWAAGSAGAVNAILWGESVDSPSPSPPSWQAPLSGIRLPGQPAVAPPIGPASGSERSAFDVVTPLPISQFVHPLSLVLGARLFPAPQPIIPPAGAQVFNQALTATVTTAASIVKSVGKLLSATSTTTASLVKSVGKILSATSTTTASLTAAKITALALTATVTTSASIVKSVGKLLSATCTTTATIVKQVGKKLTATVTTTATLSAIKVLLVNLTATVTSTATMARSVGKPLSATATSTASLVKSVGKKLTATSTTTASLAASRAFLKTLSATVTSTASISRSVGKNLSATVTASASITKQIAIRLSATVSSSASIVANFSGLSALRTLFFGRNRPRGGIGSGSPGASGFGRNQPHGGTGQGSPDAQEFSPPSPEQEQ